jgi:hypothetical protein
LVTRSPRRLRLTGRVVLERKASAAVDMGSRTGLCACLAGYGP